MAKAKTSITTENRSGSAADAAAKEKRTEMPLSDLHPFEGHPFKVLDDELMEQTVESIKQIGVVSPLIVRPDPEGGFEILSGHRRLHAAQLAGLETVPVIVKEMDDDAAIIFMVDSNLQRENILPSERAFSYKMKLEAMKHQGERGDLTSAQVGPKSWAAQVVAEEAGDSKSQVKRYIRLTNLIPEILDMVDEKKIAFNPAVELSYLKPSEQKEFLEAMDYAQASPSLSQAQRLKKLSQEGDCTLDAMCEVMNEIKKDELDHVTIKNEVLRKYFPKSYTPKQMQDTIIRLLEKWQRSKQRDLGLTSEGITLNGYFVDHPEMVLGEITTESTQYGKEECTVIPIPDEDLGDQLHEAVQHIGGHYEAQELAPEEELSLQGETIPADPNVKNFSYAVVDSKGRGIIAVGQIVTDTPTEVGDEKYHSVRMIVPENFNGDVKALPALSPNEIKTILKRNFYWASTIKTPFLTGVQVEMLIRELKKKHI